MDKHQFKEKVLLWLKLNNLYPQKVKVFNTRRNGFEVRVYCPPMEYQTKKISYRKKDYEILKTDEQGRPTSFRKHGSIGHTIKQPMYIHINKSTLSNEEEKKFTIQMIKDSALLK
jgi:RNase P/RNase MRP subunit p30